MTARTYAARAVVLITPTGFCVDLETETRDAQPLPRIRLADCATRREANKHAAAFNRALAAAKGTAVAETPEG